MEREDPLALQALNIENPGNELQHPPSEDVLQKMAQEDEG